MTSESTNKLFYRYPISDINDLNESTFTRRLKKSLQNKRTAILYDIANTYHSSNELNLLLHKFIKPEDLIMVSPTNVKLTSSQFSPDKIIIKLENDNDIQQLNSFDCKIDKILCAPITKTDLKNLTIFYKKNLHNLKIYWGFRPYNCKVLNSLTVRDIYLNKINYETLSGLEIFNSNIPIHYELIPETGTSYKIIWNCNSRNPDIQISVIIPTFNNLLFLSNTLHHLIRQDIPADKFEIIIVDDGSTDNSAQIIKDLYSKYNSEINLKYIYWSKKNITRGEQNFFRPGQARNLGVNYSSAEKIIFLDSDMLVPKYFLKNCIENIKSNQIIQYQRFHITEKMSKNCPSYTEIDILSNTYIEEQNYWSKLFNTTDWMTLPNYWKYTCTYSLGITKNDFQSLGMFKKYYVSYGFEDTDLGYEAYLKNYEFLLIKIPLLHQTSYNQMQYKNSAMKRFALLQKTAELFYLQHLKIEIFDVLENFYRFQKPIRSIIRDLL